MGRILVTGACGQIGTELVQALRERYGVDSVIATGHVTRPTRELRESGPFQYLNILDMEQIAETIMNYDIDVIYHLASILSAVGERNPQLCYDVNVNGTYNVLEAARRHGVGSVIYTSSIAVFGEGAPKYNTPNETVMLPSTMYGVTKVLGELLGTYYHARFGLDFRCIRFPGIISSETLPGGGTTDYAVEMYYAAVEGKPYRCFVRRETVLPMMYMPDAINALIGLAEADPSRLKRRVFNVQSMSFSAGELEESIRRIIPSFRCEYEPDYRQAIADSWPKTLDDSAAREEWGWKPLFNLQSMTEDMIEKLHRKLKK
ncbi:MAG: NAD-dependent epimerase/dehydratase family protein [Candidatus Bathyarchaeia archaeon]|nr:NAD-dependent epimerase/dehydratase family protein [Candidatus Bathyarchaeota archaeon]